MIALRPIFRDEDESERFIPFIDRDIKSGSDWRQAISDALDSANVAVLLVSPTFLASEFVVKVELPPLLSAAQEKRLTVLWIPVSHTRTRKEYGFKHYQAAIDPSKPLDKLPGHAWKEALNHVAEEIERVAEEIEGASHEHRPVDRTKGKVANRGSTASGLNSAGRAHPGLKSHHSPDAPGHPDADHCVNQFIDRVGWESDDQQTEILRFMLRKVMIDGLSPEEAWEIKDLDRNTGRRLWFIAVKQFTAHFNRFVNRLLEFREAIQAPSS